MIVHKLPSIGDFDGPHDVALGDLDGDGDMDALVQSGPPTGPGDTAVRALLNEGAAGFTEQPLLTTPAQPRGVSLSDLEGDGDLDFVMAEAGSITRVFENDGTGTFSEVTTVFETPWSQHILLEDVNGDGLAEILFQEARDLVVFDNLTERIGPSLAQSDLVRGKSATFTVQGASPGEMVHFLLSRGEVQHNRGVPELGGLVLDLRDPIRWFASAQADVDGVATLTAFVPSNIDRGPIRTQAVIRRGDAGTDSVKSNAIHRFIGD